MDFLRSRTARRILYALMLLLAAARFYNRAHSEELGEPFPRATGVAAQL